MEPEATLGATSVVGVVASAIIGLIYEKYGKKKEEPKGEWAAANLAQLQAMLTEMQTDIAVLMDRGKRGY